MSNRTKTAASRWTPAALVVLMLLAMATPASAQFSWDGDCSINWGDCCNIGDQQNSLYTNNWSVGTSPLGCPPQPGPIDTVSLSGLVYMGPGNVSIAGMFQTGTFLCDAQGLSILGNHIFTSGMPLEPGLFRLRGHIYLFDGSVFDIGSFSTLDFQAGEIGAGGEPGQTLSIDGFGSLTKTAEPVALTRLQIPFENSGLISVQTGTLVVNAGGSSSGTIEALGDSILYFEGGTFDLDGEVRGDGLMHFHNGTANITSPRGVYHPINTLIGGYPAVVNFENDTSVENLTLTGSGTIGGAGELTIDDFTWFSASTILPGGVVTVQDTALFQTGQGSLSLHRDMELFGVADLINIDLRLTNSEIRNYGELVLHGGTSSNIGVLTCCNANLKNFGTVRKVGTGQSIIGTGFSNVDGSFIVEAGMLILDGQMASTGPITVNAGATLEFRNNQQSLFPQASITGEGTAIFGGGAGSSDVVEGVYEVAKTVINYGTVEFDSDVTIETLELVNGTLAGDGDLTITGNMTFVWGNSTFGGNGITRALGPVRVDYGGYIERVFEIDNADWTPAPPAAGGTLVIPANSPGELRGIGTLDGHVNDFAGIAPGLPGQNQPIGALAITGNFTQYSIPPGVLKIDLAGAAHDELLVGGTATLSGTLIVTGAPASGQSYTILTAANVIGNFSQVNVPAGMTVTYTPTAVIVQAPGVLCPADIDPDGGNGAVNIDDYTEVILNWGASGTAPQGDTDGDGLVNINDYTNVILNWGDC